MFPSSSVVKPNRNLDTRRIYVDIIQLSFSNGFISLISNLSKIRYRLNRSVSCTIRVNLDAACTTEFRSTTLRNLDKFLSFHVKVLVKVFPVSLCTP